MKTPNNRRKRNNKRQPTPHDKLRGQRKRAARVRARRRPCEA